MTIDMVVKFSDAYENCDIGESRRQIMRALDRQGLLQGQNWEDNTLTLSVKEEKQDLARAIVEKRQDKNPDRIVNISYNTNHVDGERTQEDDETKQSAEHLSKQLSQQVRENDELRDRLGSTILAYEERISDLEAPLDVVGDVFDVNPSSPDFEETLLDKLAAYHTEPSVEERTKHVTNKKTNSRLRDRVIATKTNPDEILTLSRGPDAFKDYMVRRVVSSFTSYDAAQNAVDYLDAQRFLDEAEKKLDEAGVQPGDKSQKQEVVKGLERALQAEGDDEVLRERKEQAKKEIQLIEDYRDAKGLVNETQMEREIPNDQREAVRHAVQQAQQRYTALDNAFTNIGSCEVNYTVTEGDEALIEIGVPGQDVEHLYKLTTMITFDELGRRDHVLNEPKSLDDPATLRATRTVHDAHLEVADTVKQRLSRLGLEGEIHYEHRQRDII